MTPTPMPATKATVRFTIAPTMAAVSASSSSSGLSTSVRDAVWPGASRMAVKADEHPGQRPGQRSRCAGSRPPRGGPSRRSRTSPAWPGPRCDHRTNAASAMATMGATIRVSTCAGGEEVGADGKEMSKGTGNGL